MASPTVSSHSRSLAASMSSPTRRADAMRRTLLAALGLLALASAMGCASGAVRARSRGGAAAGLRPRRRRVHAGAQGTARRQGGEARPRSREGAGIASTTFSAAAGSRPSARYEEALLELQVAAELNPSNGDVEDLLRSTRLALRNKIAVSREGKTKLENADGARARVGAHRRWSCRKTSSCRPRSCSGTPAAATS